LRRCADFVLTGLLLWASLVVLALSTVRFQIRLSGEAEILGLSSRLLRGRGADPQQEFQNEFRFDRAIQAYEELIDAAFAESRG